VLRAVFGRGSTAHSFCFNKTSQAEVTKAGEKSPDGAGTVRLTACLEAAGVKTETRGARVYVDDICHDIPTIVIHSAGYIAAKPHSRE
jgi:hypothetical protein